MLDEIKLDAPYDVVYCIDKKFNKQAFLSIASLYKTNLNFNYKIFIIHKSPKSFMKFVKMLKKLFPQCDINLLKFKYNIKNYPNLKNSHVSEATYYRMFIADHIQTSSNFIVYIDADAFFVKDIDYEIKKIKNLLKSQNLLLSAKTEYTLSQAPELFSRLDINNRYFNAGVMIINYKKWKSEKVSNELKNIVNEKFKNINYWDQDVINSYVDGKFEELPVELNYVINSNANESFIPKEISIVHYAGKNKPWDKKGNSLMQKTYYRELERYFQTLLNE